MQHPPRHTVASPQPTNGQARARTGAAAAITAAMRLTHPFPTALVVILSWILIAAARGTVPPFDLSLRAIGTVLMTQIPVGALNDYVDREADAVTQPYKPIPAGETTSQVALALTFGSLACLLPLAASFGPKAFVAIWIATAGGLAYDLWLKATPLSPVGYFTGFLGLITWIWIVAGTWRTPYFLIYPAGVLLLLAAHLANAYPDIDADRDLGMHGLPATLGRERAGAVIIGCCLVVLAGEVVLGIVDRAFPDLAILAGALGLLLAATALLRGRPSRARTVWFFRVTAASISLLAVGGFLVLSGLPT